VVGPGGGDVAGSADYGSTETAVGLVADFEKELQEAQALYRNLIDKELPAFNASIAGKGIASLQTTGAPPASVPVGRDRY
jgi:hypothetical protein